MFLATEASEELPEESSKTLKRHSIAEAIFLHEASCQRHSQSWARTAAWLKSRTSADARLIASVNQSKTAEAAQHTDRGLPVLIITFSHAGSRGKPCMAKDFRCAGPVVRVRCEKMV